MQIPAIRLLKRLTLLFICLIVPSLVYGTPGKDVIQAIRADEAPVIDGKLDDAVWQKNTTADGAFHTYNPMYGEKLPYRTIAWVANDNKYIYIAFHCLDEEPRKIKTSIGKRDSIFSDDWVGLMLDTFGNHQNAYEFFVNPSGIQGDLFNTSTTGEDSAPDWVWDSAGRITDDGYQVEIRIPLRSIRYNSGKNCKMGILFWRRISRMGISGSWPELPPGQRALQTHAPISFEGLSSQRKLEILPSFTYGRNTERTTPDQWGPADSVKNFGIGVKYGLTSSMTAEMTINPDFSQVESDSFQVLVNQRYPVFYSEKRPFFMESMGLFNIAATGGDTNMRVAVHTRRIVDPDWGVKLTGDHGRTTFGVLATGDKWPGLSWDDEVNPNLGKNANFFIARGMVSLSNGSYVGGLYSGREFGGGYNRVAGTDAIFRIGKNHSINASFLYSMSKDEDTSEETTGNLVSCTYSYGTKKLDIWTCLEQYSPDFRMDTAFYNRTGFRRATVYVGPQLYPNPDRLPWLKRINPFIFAYSLHDTVSGLDDHFFLAGLRFYCTRQAWLRLDWSTKQEGWADQLFHPSSASIRGNIQLTNQLRLGGNVSFGNRIYYDPDDPFIGKGLSGGFDFTLQPNQWFKQYLSYDHTDLTRSSNNEEAYSVNIVNSQTTFQFNKYFFIRATARYDSYQKMLLTDFLASYTYIPGTVIHLGYGGIYERQEWQNNSWNKGIGSLTSTQRSLFFKVSYRWQL